MRFTVLAADSLESDVYHCELSWNGHVMMAAVVGKLDMEATEICGEVTIDEVMSCREAGADQAEGFTPGPGFHVVCGTIGTVYDWGSCDLLFGDERVMLDAEEVPGLEPVTGTRISIGFKDLVVTLD
ncbi:MAG: hypothetical protein PF961_21865 [Planctomycetota bacterium]|jgi:hypothetical protein|nr:hypothetical protein [Planctomycetota bacterium]